MKRILAALFVVAALAACSQDEPSYQGPDPEVERLNDELAASEQDLAHAEKELAGAKVDILRLEAQLRRADKVAGEVADFIREQARTIQLYEGCMQDIIDETNRVYNLYQWAPALRTAFNGANCSDLGYYWG